MEFKKGVRAFYIGEMAEYRYVLFTLVSSEFVGNTTIYHFLGVNSAGETKSLATSNPEAIMQIAYDGSPKYKIDDELVYWSGMPSYSRVRVVHVLPSTGMLQNIYTLAHIDPVPGALLGTFELPETEIWPLDLSKVVDSTLITMKHINRVAELMDMVAMQLIQRGNIHDASKLTPVEKLPLDAMQYINDNEPPAPYGSEEYIRRAKMLKPMLKHHYANNSHHPEHHENGVYGMTLFDVVEMWCGWVAASERGKESSVNLTHAAERYQMSDQLKRIFANTYDAMNLPYK